MSLTLEQACLLLKSANAFGAEVPFVELLKDVTLIFDNHLDFLAYYKKIDTDFIYDTTSGLYFIGVKGKHVDLNAELYRYYVRHVNDVYQASDLYIEEGYGMFKSRGGRKIYKGASFVVSSELRSIQRDIEVI